MIHTSSLWYLFSVLFSLDHMIYAGPLCSSSPFFRGTRDRGLSAVLSEDLLPFFLPVSRLFLTGRTPGKLPPLSVLSRPFLSLCLRERTTDAQRSLPLLSLFFALSFDCLREFLPFCSTLFW